MRQDSKIIKAQKQHKVWKPKYKSRIDGSMSMTVTRILY